MATLNTIYDTPTCSPVDTSGKDTSSNRFCALESTPVLRTKLHTMAREFSCTEKGGEFQYLQSQERISDTLWVSTETGGEQIDYNAKAGKLQKSNHLAGHHLGLYKLDRERKPTMIKSNPTDAPIALRTRSKSHQQDTALMIDNHDEVPYQSQSAVEINLKFIELTKKAEERYLEISSKIQAICDWKLVFSEQQAAIILELQKELATLRVSKDAAIDDQLVKQTKENVTCASQIESTVNQSGQIQPPTSIRLEGSDLQSTPPSEPVRKKSSELVSCSKKSEFDSRSARASNVTKIQTGAPSTSGAKEEKLYISPSFIPSVTKRQPIRPDRLKSPSTTNQSNGKEKQSTGRGPNHSRRSEIAVEQNDTSQVHFAFTARDNGKQDTSSDQGSEDTNDSFVQHRKRFHLSDFCSSKDERREAYERIQKALNKVPDKVSWDFNGDRTICDLYVGNLDFNANRGDLLKSLRPYFGRVHVENVSIPPGKGSRNRGYGFVALSWARDAAVDPADICSMLSGRIKVNSRRIYLCETQDSNHSTSYGSNDTSTASSAASDNAESKYDAANICAMLCGRMQAHKRFRW